MHGGWWAAAPAGWVAVLVYPSDANKEHHYVDVLLGFSTPPPQELRFVNP